MSTNSELDRRKLVACMQILRTKHEICIRFDWYLVIYPYLNTW